MDTLFDGLLAEVNRLHTHSDWLPIERSQISFYSQQLSSLSNSYQILKITDHPGSLCLHILASVDYFNDPDPPDLSLVGDQLAFEVAQIFDISLKDFRKASPEFASRYFHFDRNRYQEQVDGEVFVGFHDEAGKLLQQLASITRRKLEVISIVGMAGLDELLQLVHLRYLELRFRSGNPPECISDLRELQTLIMSSRINMVVPKNMWKMISLRHLCIKSGENPTMSLVSPTRPCQRILSRTRNLHKLGLCGSFTTKSGDLKFPDLGLLMHLKTLKLLNTVPLCKAGRLSDSIIFPESLKSLCLSNTYLDWSEGWAFEMIPNLEVLKLKFHAFVGENWETSLEAFPRLKILVLDELDIVNWTASRSHFPVLQRLQVYRCSCLIEIPEDLGSICTLEWIELSGCSDAATNSAIEIQKYQMSIGNDWLKILLNTGLSKQMHKRSGRSGDM
ncbi:hypothetical protein AG4045_002244 [Apium graveolens]|uniref:Disease resistance R13L4/SHOC-2-like LRR domain-containing protein n=1 Tax=Apium graveolens TaxID=4045 RepID=A0A6L5BA16_APIGR|nr:hypothetical protein AG4045_002244 [Apium graveolens]